MIWERHRVGRVSTFVAKAGPFLVARSAVGWLWYFAIRIGPVSVCGVGDLVDADITWNWHRPGEEEQ